MFITLQPVSNGIVGELLAFLRLQVVFDSLHFSIDTAYEAEVSVASLSHVSIDLQASSLLHYMHCYSSEMVLLDMKKRAESAVNRGSAHLMRQQNSTGSFDGKLSSSTFPSCAYAWVKLAQNQLPDQMLIDWFLKNQNQDGTWGLDAANHPNREATLFAKLMLAQVARQKPNPQIAEALKRTPNHPLALALIKLAYAAFGEFKWEKLTIPRRMLPVMTLTKKLLTRFPALQSLLKPPSNALPPVDLFNTPTFGNLFIAEQYTLVAVFIMIELNTSQRPEIIDSLVIWLKEHMLPDNSWFRVNYITALSVLALIELQRVKGIDDDIQEIIDRGIAWLQSTRNADGGCREALNLNVWDTALSVISLLEIADFDKNNEIHSACKWLIENQNLDGGWAFSRMGPNENLPSDADDTALATLALIKSKTPFAAAAIQRGLNWLTARQRSDGCWSTYLPGQGDVGCVSITAHAIETLHEATGMEAQISRATRWITGQTASEGYWTDLWLAKRTYGTACAIIALIKAGMKEIPEVSRGVRWLETVQNSDGGWGEDMFGNRGDSTIEQTAWCTHALLLANPENRAAQNGLNLLLSRQESDGSWDASCVGIYWEVIGGYADSIYASVFPLRALNQYLKGAE